MTYSLVGTIGIDDRIINGCWQLKDPLVNAKTM